MQHFIKKCCIADQKIIQSGVNSMKILIWGTGGLVGTIIDVYISLEKIDAFIDNNPHEEYYLGKKVLTPNQLVSTDYDAILVANSYSQEIYEQCKALNLDLSKIIFLFNNCRLEDFNQDYFFVEKVVGKDFTKIIKERVHLMNDVDFKSPYISSEFICMAYDEIDYVRVRSLALAVEEIERRKLDGAVAELGVFRGAFARFLNVAFPERKLYLFDTFEGFDEREAAREIDNKTCTRAVAEIHKQTNIQTVLEKMKYDKNIIIKQGLFPESLNGLEERFVFVSLDVDLEDSMYEGLCYFYPRLVSGGYIFVHDYNGSSGLFTGVKRAIERYEKELNVILCKMPICDISGTLVITK